MRRRLTRRGSRRLYNATYKKTHRMNLIVNVPRGGIRL